MYSRCKWSPYGKLGKTWFTTLDDIDNQVDHTVIWLERTPVISNQSRPPGCRKSANKTTKQLARSWGRKWSDDLKCWGQGCKLVFSLSLSLLLFSLLNLLFPQKLTYICFWTNPSVCTQWCHQLEEALWLQLGAWQRGNWIRFNCSGCQFTNRSIDW